MIGGEGFATGQPVNQIGVDRPDKGFAGGQLRGDVGLVANQPGKLGGGEVGVDPETGLAGDCFGAARTSEIGTDFFAAPALPDDGGMQRFAGGAIENDEGFPLIGNAETGGIAELVARPLGQAFDRGEGVVPNLGRVMLNEARLGVELAVFD